MAGVAGAQVLAHLRPGALPEAGEVVGHLLGTLVGREQVQQAGHAPPRDGRGGGQPEELLDPHREDRRSPRLVAQADLGSRRDPNALGCEPLEGTARAVRERAQDEARHRTPLEILEGAAALDESRQQTLEEGALEGLEATPRLPLQRAGDARGELLQLGVAAEREGRGSRSLPCKERLRLVSQLGGDPRELLAEDERPQGAAPCAAHAPLAGIEHDRQAAALLAAVDPRARHAHGLAHERLAAGALGHEGEDDLGLGHAGLAREAEAASIDAPQPVGARLPAHGQPVGEGRQQGAGQRLVGILSARFSSGLALHEAQQLVPRSQDLPAGPGAQAARGPPPEVELLERIEPCVEVGVRARGASGSLPVERIALGQERRSEGRGPRNAERLALEQEAPQSRVHGEPSEALPQRREAPVGHGAEELEQLLRALQGSGLRSLEPGERRGVGLAEGQQLEHRPREVEAPHLRRLGGTQAALIDRAPQPEREARGQAARPARSLVGARHRDARDLETIETHRRVVA